MFRLFKNKAAVKKYLLIFFLSIVSIGMVITLAPLPSGDISRGDTGILAEISGSAITSQDLQQMVDTRLKNSSIGNNPQLVARLARPVLDDMVSTRVLDVEARKLGIQVSQREVDSALESNPMLYPGGTFVGDEQAENILQQQYKLTPQQYLGQLREGLLLEKLRHIVTDGIEVTPGEVHADFLRRNEKAKIDYVLIDPSQFIKSVNVTTQALEAFFEKDPDRYKLPEQRRIRYILIDQDRVRARIKLSDEDLRRYYDEHLSDYRVPERVKVSHILFKTTGKTPAEIATLEKTARDVLAQIRAGKDFAELARQYSEDSSAQQGGDIGWIVRGQTEKEFENTAFAMKSGQVSGLVKTVYGIHILKVLEKQIAHLQSFDEVKNGLRADLEKQKLEDAQQDLADDLFRQFKATPRSFEAVAQKSGFEVLETPLIRYNEVAPDFGKSEAFSNLAFQLAKGEVGQPITVAKGVAIIQVAEIVPEHTPKLDEVRSRIEENYRAQESKTLALNKASAFASKAKAGDFKAVAKRMGLAVKESKEFARQDFVEDLGAGSELPAAFKLAPGATSDVSTVGGKNLVFRVESRTPANEADFAGQRDQIAEELLNQKRELAFEVYSQNLKQQFILSGEVKMNEAAISRFLATYQR